MTVRVDLPYEEFTLHNGLRVFVHEHHAVPVVAVNLWYHVGSRNERPGRTGFAHLFEHLMFEGSAHVPPGQFDRLLEDVGATNNGSTSPDRTNYWITLPAHALELALWLESDRMGWLPPAITQRQLDNQRNVVMNERRQSYENRPYGLAWERILAELYAPDHPYHWPTIGSMEDLRAATLEDVLEFFATWYVPNNATLAIAGAADAGQIRELVEKYFGEIPRAALPSGLRPPPARLDTDHRGVLEDDVHLPRLYLAWHSPAAFGAGDAELDVAARALAHGKLGRLYRDLVHERQIAQDVHAFQGSGQLCSSFTLVVTARPPTTLREVERHAREALEAIADAGVTEDELERAKTGIEAEFVDELQTVGGFGGRADRLNLYAFHTGDAGWIGRDLERYRTLDSDAVRNAVAAMLGGASVTLDVVPGAHA